MIFEKPTFHVKTGSSNWSAERSFCPQKKKKKRKETSKVIMLRHRRSATSSSIQQAAHT
jgi:hypothetical protein